jgi:NAD+ synthase (glutamine-hydrolysing)
VRCAGPHADGADEDGYLLYFCKAGDGVVDVQLIADLHKSEVFAVGAHLGVPKSILDAPPSADLWEGQTDEGELGMSYDFVELYTEYLKLDATGRAAMVAGLSQDALAEFHSLGGKADAVHRRNSHKKNFPHNINILE